LALEPAELTLEKKSILEGFPLKNPPPARHSTIGRATEQPRSKHPAQEKEGSTVDPREYRGTQVAGFETTGRAPYVTLAVMANGDVLRKEGHDRFWERFARLKPGTTLPALAADLTSSGWHRIK